MEPSRLRANYLRALLTSREIPLETTKTTRKATAATHTSGRTRESMPMTAATTTYAMNPRAR